MGDRAPAPASMQARVATFVQRHGLAKPVEAAALDLVSEVGELAKEVLIGSDYGRRPFAARPETAGEIGDALYSLLDLANVLGVDADGALSEALAKYERRLAARGRASSS